jgi:flagellar basal-body rod modification protein FlgD
MNTAIVSSTTSTTSSTSTSSTQTLDKDAFLKLLVAQLQNQDPTSAQDPNEMVNQMTSYAQLEQLQNMNTALTSLETQNQGIFQAEATSLVGKKVRVTSSSFNLSDGSASVGVDLASDAASVTLTIKNAAGTTVATLDEGSQTSGTHTFEWDGTDGSGNALADGSYTVEVAAKDADGNAVTAATSSYVTVDSVLFASGSVLLVADGKTYTLDNVNEVSD